MTCAVTIQLKRIIISGMQPTGHGHHFFAIVFVQPNGMLSFPTLADHPRSEKGGWMKAGKILSAAFQTILGNTRDMMFVKDINLVYVAASPMFVQMAGKNSASEIIGYTDFDIFADRDLARRYVSDDRTLLQSGRDLVDYIEPIVDPNGQARYSSTSKYILTDKNHGGAIGILGIGRDVTQEYVIRQRHQQELKYLFTLPEKAYGAIYFDIDTWRIIEQRRHVTNGITMPQCEGIDQLRDMALNGIAGDKQALHFYRNFTQKNMQKLYSSGRLSTSVKYHRRMSHDISRWVRDELHFLVDPTNGHRCVMFFTRDIEDEKEKELHLIRAADIDELTGLNNRAATMRHIREFLAGEGRDGVHALFIIDVDNFKAINDTFGHQAGDTFLTTLAERIKSCFREIDIVGRIGGDEFFAFMKNVPNLAGVGSKANLLLQKMIEAYTLDVSLSVSGSIGISIYGQNGTTLDELYASADEALYEAKRRGKNMFCFAPVKSDG